HTRSTRDWSSDVCSSDLREVRRLRELLPDDLRRFDDGDALLDALLDGPRLEPAVGVWPKLLRRDVAQSFADPLGGDLDRLGVVRDRQSVVSGERLAPRRG